VNPTRSPMLIALELRRCEHDYPQRLPVAGGVLLRCLACGAVHLAGAWQQPLLVDELAAAVVAPPPGALDDDIGSLFDMCRCGHDRGEHLGKAPFPCDEGASLAADGDAILVHTCACKAFELEPKSVTPRGVVDAVWEDRTPSNVVDLSKYRVRS
jgi:hypothetical protein